MALLGNQSSRQPRLAALSGTLARNGEMKMFELSLAISLYSVIGVMVAIVIGG